MASEAGPVSTASAAAPALVDVPAVYEALRKKHVVSSLEAGQLCKIQGKLMETVKILDSTGGEVVVEGKIKTLLIDRCSNIKLTVDTLIASLEVVRVNDCTISVVGTAPTIQLDNSAKVAIQLMDSALKVNVFTNKCDEISLHRLLPQSVSGEERATVSLGTITHPLHYESMQCSTVIAPGPEGVLGAVFAESAGSSSVEAAVDPAAAETPAGGGGAGAGAVPAAPASVLVTTYVKPYDEA